MKNIRQHLNKPILIAIVTGLLCNYIWLHEVLFSKGWYSLQWLDGYMISVLIIIPLTVFAFIYSIHIVNKLNRKTFLISLFGLSVISMISFEIARMVLYTIYSRFFFFGLSIFVSILTVLVAIMIPVFIFSLGYYALINKLIIKTPKKAIFLFVLSIIFSVIAGLITVAIIPGFGHGKSFVDSVKMGYPIFWLNLSLGLTSMIILRWRLKNEIHENSDKTFRG